MAVEMEFPDFILRASAVVSSYHKSATSARTTSASISSASISSNSLGLLPSIVVSF